MSLGLWPEAVPFDPESGTAVSELRKHFDAGALPAAVLLVPARSLRDSSWAARTAVVMARAIAASRTVVLADLDFEQPTLHAVVGEPNGEGIADALLFGASLERVTLTPAGEPFEFVPAGAYAPEPEELLSHSGWSRVLAELSARKAVLLAWAPLGARGLDTFAQRIPAVIILAAEDEVTPTVALLPETIRVEGVIRPAVAAPVESDADDTAAEAGMGVSGADSDAGPSAEEGKPRSEPAQAESAEAAPSAPPSPTEKARLPKDEAREALMAELRAREKSARPQAAPAPAEALADTDNASAPVRDDTGVSRRVLGVAVVVMVLIIAVRFLMGLFSGDTVIEDEPDRPIVTSSRSGTPEPAGDILGFSIAIESYDRLPAAVARADSLGMAESAVSFYIAPFRLDSATYYRVLAGPFVDSAAAATIMQGLVDRGLKMAVSKDDVRSTPLAFEIGRYTSREEALQRMDDLKSRDIPSYVVDVPYTSGPPRYHLYAGAYGGPTEAGEMRSVLRRAGIQDTLVLRVGRTTR